MIGGGIGSGGSSLSLSSDVSRSSMALGCDCILSKNAVGEAGAGAECKAGEGTSVGICKDSKDGRPRRSARADVGDRSDVGLSERGRLDSSSDSGSAAEYNGADPWVEVVCTDILEGVVDGRYIGLTAGARGGGGSTVPKVEDSRGGGETVDDRARVAEEVDEVAGREPI